MLKSSMYKYAGCLLEIAETNQLEIHLENLYQVARNSDFGYSGDRTGDFDYFLDQLKSPSFKICYDYGYTLADWLFQFGDNQLEK